MEELFVYRVYGNVDPQAVKLPEIEGLRELWDATQERIRYLALRKEYEDGFITKLPPKPTADVAKLREQYPRAEAYIYAMIWADVTHPKKAALGKQAMERIIAGEDPFTVLDEMTIAWAAFRVAQMEG